MKGKRGLRLIYGKKSKVASLNKRYGKRLSKLLK